MVGKSIIIAAALIGGFALLLVGGALVYDHTRQDTIAAGVKVGPVDVGGLTAEQAKAKVQREVLVPLRRQITVRSGDRRFHLTAKEAQVTANVNQMVAAAVAASREGNPFSRSWRGVTGGAVDERIAPSVDYSRDAVARLVDRVRVASSRPAQNAEVDYGADTVTVHRSHSGRTVQVAALRARVKAALADPSLPRTLVAPSRITPPKVTTKQLARKYPTIITVERGAFRLRLFKNLKLVKTYGIAVGAAGLETPAGLYNIQNKAVNPAWHVPNSAWAGDLAGTVVPPGPSNPIKARWMGIFDGAGIHGTSDDASIGSNASHGCIRMHVWDVEELYDRVPVGAPVYIA